ncbi:MAG: MvdC/MvdD family ATP grasp protein [Patescibacteria group bacterium]
MNIKNKSVLVLTNSKDGPRTDEVISKLQEKGEQVFRFDTDRLQGGQLNFEFHVDNNSCGFEMRNTNTLETITSDEIKSVWYRRPNQFNLNITDSVQKKFAEEEIRYGLEGMWLALPLVFWLSNPHNIERARKKLFQLSVARNIGFIVPQTLVTNSPDEVKEFLQTCHGKMIFKTIKQGFLDYGDRGFNIPTTLVTEKHIENIGLVQSSPCLFQECIEKEYELRITMVGTKIFAIRIDSQVHPDTSVDWRNPKFIDSLNYSLVKLPDNIETMCHVMMQKLDLKFGAFDLAVNRQGKYMFFEVNPNGQWYWIERNTGACISDAIADILSSVQTHEGR